MFEFVAGLGKRIRIESSKRNDADNSSSQLPYGSAADFNSIAIMNMSHEHQ